MAQFKNFAAYACIGLFVSATLGPDVRAQEQGPSAIPQTVAQANAAVLAGGTGPYKAAMYSDPGLPTHTIYRPRDLETAMRGGRLPIIVWGNGACTNVGNRFRYFLTELASYGYIIIAVGPVGPSYMEWKVDLSAPPPDSAGRPPAKSTAVQLIDGIDWAISENERTASDYFGRLDTRAIAAMGQSCGGLQAISAAADPRVRTTVVLNSGTFPEGSPPLHGTGDANKASLARLHGPTLWLSGDPSDIAHRNAGEDYQAAGHIPAYWLWRKGTGHAEHFRKPHGGEFGPPVRAWLEWRLKGSRNAGLTFADSDCLYCTSPEWVIISKGETVN